MVGDAQVLLNFVEVIVVDNGDGVLLCIVGLLLQSLIQLREAQRLGVMVAMMTGFSGVRISRPFMSAGLLMGPLELVTQRKPLQ